MTDKKLLKKIGEKIVAESKADVLNYKAIAECGLDLQLMAFTAEEQTNKGGFETCR